MQIIYVALFYETLTSIASSKEKKNFFSTFFLIHEVDDELKFYARRKKSSSNVINHSQLFGSILKESNLIENIVLKNCIISLFCSVTKGNFCSNLQTQEICLFNIYYFIYFFPYCSPFLFFCSNAFYYFFKALIFLILIIEEKE